MIRVTVTSTEDGGHYRCGVHWPQRSTHAQVDQSVLDTLQSDPRLRVEVNGDVEGDPDPDLRDLRSEPAAVHSGAEAELRTNFPARSKLMASGLTTLSLVSASNDEVLGAAGLSDEEIAKVRKAVPPTDG